MDSREYEHSVARLLVEHAPEFAVKYNTSIHGNLSETARQVDVLLLNRQSGERIVVECKYYGRKLNVKIADSFIGFLEDISISRGILVTNLGASRAALNRIALSQIQVTVLGDNDLEHYRLRGLIPFGEERMAFMSEPVGYVGIGKVSGFPGNCILLPIGKPYKTSRRDGTFLYVNLVKETTQVEALLVQEEKDLDEYYSVRLRHTMNCEGRIKIRLSLLAEKERYDFAVSAVFSKGSIVVHGLVERKDLRWTLTSIKKSLYSARFLEAPIESETDEQITWDLRSSEGFKER